MENYLQVPFVENPSVSNLQALFEKTVKLVNRISDGTDVLGVLTNNGEADVRISRVRTDTNLVYAIASSMNTGNFYNIRNFIGYTYSVYSLGGHIVNNFYCQEMTVTVGDLSPYNLYGPVYETAEAAYIAMTNGIEYPITYRDTNAVHSGPTEAAVGDTVEVSYSFTDGYGIVNPSNDIYVTNNGVLVPSTYADGKLTFTMPSPS